MDHKPSLVEDMKSSSKAIIGVIAFTTAVSTVLVDIFNFDSHWTIGITIGVTLLIVCSILFISRMERRSNAMMADHIKESSKTFEKIDNTLKELRHMTADVRRDTLRIQLREYIKDEPENLDTILTIAREYFGVYHGNWIASHEFLEWADQHHIHVPTDIHNAINHSEKSNNDNI